MGWKPVANAPFDRDLELAVIDYDGPHALVFPCRRILSGWVNSQTKARLAPHGHQWSGEPIRVGSEGNARSEAEASGLDVTRALARHGVGLRDGAAQEHETIL